MFPEIPSDKMKWINLKICLCNKTFLFPDNVWLLSLQKDDLSCGIFKLFTENFLYLYFCRGYD